MKLEDEFGDIVGKARRGQKIPEAHLADAAGLSPYDINAIEDYTLIPSDDQIISLATVLGLNASRLIRIVRGEYIPQHPDLQQWGCVAVLQSHYASMEVNAFLIWDKTSKQAALFDTGTDFQIINNSVKSLGLNLSIVALTHTHGDHTAVLDQVYREFTPRVLCSTAELVANGDTVFDLDLVEVGSLSIEVRETPGHSSGGLTFVVTGFSDSPPLAVVGDALFAGSAGGASYSYERLIANIQNKILSLPDDTLILPGHGPLTTVGQEKQNNPFAP